MTPKKEPSLLTIAELSRSLELPESTTRYYCNRFAAHLPSVGEGRRRRFRPEAFEKLRTIAETMRRDKNAYAVDLALRSQDAGGSAPPVMAAQDVSFAAQMLSLLENQTKAMQDIAEAMGVFTAKLSGALPAPSVEGGVPGPASTGDANALRKEINELREQMRVAESVHQNDLEQLRKWLTRLGEALANK